MKRCSDRWRLDWLTLTAPGAVGRRALRELTYEPLGAYATGPAGAAAFKAAGFDGDPVALEVAAQSGARRHGYQRGWSDVFGLITGERGEGDEGETVLIATGNALQKLPTAEGFLRACLNTPGVRCTRLDVARDHFGGWRPWRVRRAYEAGLLVSGFRESAKRAAWEFYQEGHNVTGAVGGRRGSELLLRVYDKLAQLRKLGKPVPADVRYWTRWEFALGGSRADAAFGYLRGGGSLQELHQAVLGRYPVRVVRKGAELYEKNRWRAAPSRLWSKFIEDGGAWREFPTLGDGPEASSDDETAAAKAARFARVMGPTFAALCRLVGAANVLRVFDEQAERDERFAWSRIPKASVQRAAVQELLELPADHRRVVEFMQRCRRG